MSMHVAASSPDRPGPAAIAAPAEPADPALSKVATFKSFVRWSAVVFLLRVGGTALTYVTYILLARWMGAAELGNYVFAFSACMVVSSLTTLGYPASAVRFVRQAAARDQRDEVAGFLKRGNQLSFIASIVAMLGGLAFLWWRQGTGGMDGALALAFVGVPLFAILQLHSSYAQSISNFTAAFLPSNFLRQLFLLLIVVAWQLLWGGLSASLVMLFTVAMLPFLLLGQHVYIDRGLKPLRKGASPTYRTWFWTRTSLELQLLVLFTTYFQEMSLTIAGFFLPSEDMAVYSACFRTANLISFGLYAINAILSPQASHLIANKNAAGLQSLVARATQLRFWPSLAAVAVLVVAGQQILHVFGPDFARGQLTLVILGVSQLVIAAAGPVTQILTLSGHQTQSLLAFAISLVATLALNALLLPLFGMLGGAVASLLVTLIWNLWLHRIVVRHVGITPSVLSLRHCFSGGGKTAMPGSAP
ncbi:lipopolysaccharide biosynthesis protein [Hypericibacter terrae]|nr:polysaccharide biosynthesis C-terminal domain-containing protein [Hypericibacter terrae]